MKFPCSSRQSHYPNTSGLGPGNISYYDILYIAPGRAMNFKGGANGEWLKYSTSSCEMSKSHIRFHENSHLVDQFGDSLWPEAVSW